MPLVRTTMEPWKEFWATDREAENLRGQGILLEDDAPRAAEAPGGQVVDDVEHQRQLNEQRQAEAEADGGQTPTTPSDGVERDSKAKGRSTAKAKDTEGS